MFCFHKYGKVEEGFQYCNKCGISKRVSPLKCNHEFEIIERGNVSWYGDICGTWYLQKCTKCGELKYFKTTEQR